MHNQVRRITLLMPCTACWGHNGILAEPKLAILAGEPSSYASPRPCRRCNATGMNVFEPLT